MIFIEKRIQGILLLFACTKQRFNYTACYTQVSCIRKVHEPNINPQNEKKGHETSMPRQKECEKGTKSQIKIA